MKRTTSLLLKSLGIVILAGGMWCPSVEGQTEDSPPALVAEESDSPWRIESKSWLWLMGMEGEAGIGPVQLDIDADFGDVLDASDSLMAFSGRLEIGKGPYTAYIDGLWAKIGADNLSGPAGISKVDLTQELGIVDFGLMYRIFDGPLMGEHQPAGHRSTIDVYGGARYTTVSLELDPANLRTFTSDNDWIDPIVGIKLTQPFTDSLHMEIWGDVGGFGAASDMTWSATAVLGYDVTVIGLPLTIYGGYRAIGWDYSNGSGADAFDWDVILHGPTLGFSILF